LKKLLIFLVKIYRKHISPLSPPKCKYYPTCSTYALDALNRHGAAKGFALSLWRVLRCNVMSLGGVDYVPRKFSFYRLKQMKQDSTTRTSVKIKNRNK
jgi:putative membrane protein insertion efficiency factor